MRDIVDRFFDNVKERPSHAAVIEDNCSVSYEELGRVASRIAAALSSASDHPKVFIHLPQCADAYAAMFGTLMVGGYYTPTNVNSPVLRNIEILRQFSPDVVLSNKELSKDFPLNEMGIKFVDIEELPTVPLNTIYSSHDLAYVIFTSGSTGDPKGVMIPREGLSHYVRWAIRDMGITAEDRMSQHPNIAFDLSVLDIYGALCAGATLCPLTSKIDRLLPGDFIRRCKLTIWNSVPSVVDLMIRARQVTTKHFDSLRLLTFCGEPLYQRHLDAIFAANPYVQVNNTYGPTEATVSCTLICLSVDNYRMFSGSSIALGSAIDGMEMELMGGDDSTEGELILSGPQLARGYWNNQEETKRVFNIVQTSDGSRRYYRTGDWCKIEDGQLYFKDRIDTQVKIRGNRVELSEIDSAISGLGYGNSYTVFVDNMLHSFVETDSLPDLSVIRSALACCLPEYEIPTKISAINVFPRNANDKVDRKQLVRLVNDDLSCL
ncbi:AMP-binding protein [Desulfoluna butyratoxydans]|uniref:Amp-dependent synthetase/ligase n=1 Tax=Desulfoluna butyratoxydans TaxID=231438 RepID=A0A4U8YQL9_9BACT|nr:AMP-binding protein [Desulfoluna butyratoxydans]VFQ46151.1 amp-dependent synthetase/ligase [Desulfoluna butyratoxydans]